MTGNPPPRVLLVEDNPDHAELLRLCFEQQDMEMELMVHRDGESALEKLQSLAATMNGGPSPLPDLILLDLRLPKLDGFEVLAALNRSAALRSVPVVVLSSSSAEADVKRAVKLQANSFISKPTHFEGYQQLARQIVNYWFGWDRLANA